MSWSLAICAELGASAAAEHRQIGELIANLKIDLVVACGDHADDIANGAEAGNGFDIASRRRRIRKR